jgi:adenosylcobinamide kinase/adenosylcobinamide-phosphate guanylyltransferase
MKPYDKEDEERIKKHIQNREGLNFITLEVQRNLHEIVNNIKSNDTILIDSITSLLTNEMFIGNEIIKNPSVNILNGLKQIMVKAKNTVIVSDYIFNDAIEYDEVTETFKRELAIINKELANISDNVMECSFSNTRYIKHEEKTIL